MKVLIIHNRYSREGGEEKVVSMQRHLLESAGVEVMSYIRDHREMDGWRLGKVRSLFTAMRNGNAVDDIRRIADEFKPDAAIVHNLFPIISAAILPELHKKGIPTAMTVHNYRLFCPVGLFFTKGGVCTECAVRPFRELSCTLRRCQGTVAGSLAFSLRGAWSRMAGYFNNVDRFLSCSDFQRGKLIRYGIPAGKITVIPNCTDAGNEIRHIKEDYVAFAGRLSPEKGIDMLFEIASGMPDTEFRVAGSPADGYSLPPVPGNVKMVGHLDGEELKDFYGKAKVLVFTSRVWEAMPLTPIEAMAEGTAVVANDVSSLPEIIENGKSGLIFSGSSDGIEKLKKILGDDLLRTSMEKAAKKRARNFYGAQRYLEQLLSVLREMGA